MNTKNPALLVLALLLIGGTVFYLESLKPERSNIVTSENTVTHDPLAETSDYAARAKKFPLAQELVQPDGYLNTTEDLTIQSLVGKKVILIDFWTYSCINCQRTQPYLNAWYDKYSSEGLEIIGVHTPEFGFEEERENVAKAIEQFKIRYPVVQDNGYATWDAYQNRYWPRKYLIDINGLIVYDHIGEGSYEETEKVIQQYLEERKEVLGEEGDVPGGFVSPGVVSVANSPETYFGWDRNQTLANGTRRAPGIQSFDAVPPYAPNELYLEGEWDIQKEYAESRVGSGVVYSYDAKEVYIVASSPTGAVVEVYVDGVRISAERGADVREDGTVFINESRLYKLVQHGSSEKHTIELRVSTPGVQIFTFTFG